MNTTLILLITLVTFGSSAWAAVPSDDSITAARASVCATCTASEQSNGKWTDKARYQQVAEAASLNGEGGKADAPKDGKPDAGR